MKFFHVYNEKYFDGLVKNNLINEDTGFKIQHIFSMPEDLKFNKFAAKGTKLHSIIKEGKIPFYVDRFSGGCIYHKYDFDKDLIREYENILGKWFLGFQMHESASNIRQTWIYTALPAFNGDKGPYGEDKIREKMMSSYAFLPDGTQLPSLAHYTLSEFAKLRCPETQEEFIEQMADFYKKRMDETLGNLLMVDSYYFMTKLQDELGAKAFMPEIGWQIQLTRLEYALARGIAEPQGKIWGGYYETWGGTIEEGGSIPCYNSEPGNEWYLDQEQHPDDFTTKGKNGGSSRLLQKRLYYYTLMSGADTFGEEWGLNCSYTDMTDTYELSEYGIAKKEFIDFARDHKTVKANIPFAIVLPNDYKAIEINNPFVPYFYGEQRDTFMDLPLIGDKKKNFNYVEDVLRFVFARNGKVSGNEGHSMTNSRFGDLFDIIYQDAPDSVFAKYEALIDASPDSGFAKKRGGDFRIFTAENHEKLEADIKKLSEEVLPVTVDNLHWILSKDGEGRRYLSIFNNEGNMRTRTHGDVVDHDVDARVKVSFKEPRDLKPIKIDNGDVKIERVDDKTYFVDVPATAFVIFEY